MVCLFVNFSFYPKSLVLYEYTLPFNQFISALLFIIAATTDGIDGYLARKRNMVTNLGKLLDPLADKLLITAILVSLVAMGKCNSWIAVIIISREFAVTGLRQIALLQGTVICASKWGKWKTTSQVISIVLLLINNFPFVFFHIPMDIISLWIAFLITTWSGIDYFVKNKHVLHLAKM